MAYVIYILIILHWKCIYFTGLNYVCPFNSREEWNDEDCRLRPCIYFPIIQHINAIIEKIVFKIMNVLKH